MNKCGVTVVNEVPPIADFIRLRALAGLSPRTVEAAARGLPRSLFGVHVLFEDQVVGMGRVVGDGALNFNVVDIAVDPAYQGRGYSILVMDAIMVYLKANAPACAFVNLMADVVPLFEKYGFQLSAPATQGMIWRR